MVQEWSTPGGDAPDPGEQAGRLGDRLTRICAAAAHELAMAGAAVELRPGSPDGGVTAAVTSDRARAWSRLELDTGEGPAAHAHRHGRPVLVADLQATGARVWPGYTSAALEAGLGAVFALPLGVGAARFGVLVLWSATPRTLDRGEQARAFEAADRAVEACLAVADAGSVAAEPVAAPFDLSGLRSEVFQAQGMVMVDLGVGLAEALALLRAHAFATGRPLDDVATDIVSGRLALPRDPPPP